MSQDCGLSQEALARMTEDLPLVEWIAIDRIVVGENPLGTAMSAEDFGRLRDHVRRFGIEDALILGPADGEGQRNLIDGFHRLKIARELGLAQVPYRECTARPEAYAIERQLARRNLSRAAQALIVFNYARKVQAAENGWFRTSALNQSLLADHFGINKGYLCDIIKAWERLVGATESEPTEKWRAFEMMIVDNGSKPSRCLAGVAGQVATAGKARSETDYTRLALGSLVSLEGSWDHAAEIDWRDEAVASRLERSSCAFAAKLPQLLRAPVAQAICAAWPEAELRGLKKQIEEQLKGR